MSNNNGFLSNYNKNMGDFGEPAGELVVSDADLGYKYEEKSGFKKPEYRGGDLPPFRRPKLLIPIIAGGVVVVGVIILLLLLLNGGVTVIDFTGRPLSDAQLWANQNGVMLATDEKFNDEYDAGTVIDQDRKSGETVKKGEFLSLTVSKGHNMSITLKVPDIMSMTADEIQAWADTNYMSKVRITAEFSDTVPSGKVIRFTINDNTVVSDEVRRDTPVYVIVSKGPQDQSTIEITVPDFKTMSVSEAYIFANENGLILTVVEQYDDYIPKNSVISQSVKAQEKISRGSEIKLVVSKGKMIEVPDFSGYTKEQASAIANGLGIPVTVIEKYSGSSAGAFLSQSIPAGSVYEDGDFLELTYSLGSITVPSFVGQTLEAIKNWENEVNKQGAKITIKPTSTNSSQPKGTIIYQDNANMTVKVGTTINVTISEGRIVYVPDFVDKTSGPNRGYDTAITRDEAITICDSVGLIPMFEKAAAFDPSKLPGEIISQGLDYPGKEILQGAKITLTYNPIRVTDVVEVPKFLELSKTDIDGDLTNKYHMDFTIIYEGDGIVNAQSIPKGSMVARGSVIILTLF